jgi:hypothetical protein
VALLVLLQEYCRRSRRIVDADRVLWMLEHYAGCCCAASCCGSICAVVALLLQHADHGPPQLLFPSVPMIILLTRDIGESWFLDFDNTPCTLVCTSTTAIQFCRNLLLSEQNRPKKNRKTEKHRENAHWEVYTERMKRHTHTHTHRMRGRCAQRDESSGSSRTKELVCIIY